MKQFLLYIFILAGLVSAQGYTDYETFQLNALSNLDKFGVYIWETDSLLLKEGLTEDSLLIIVRNNLSIPDEKLVNFVEASKLEGSPSLEIEAKTIISPDNTSVALYTAVRFIQDVIIDRDRSVRHYSAITWERDSIAVVSSYNILEETIGSLEVLLENFSRDFNFINPPVLSDSSADSSRAVN